MRKVSCVQSASLDKTYRILLIILLWINVHICYAAGCHSLIPVSPRNKSIFTLIVMHTLDDFRPDQRTFRDNAFQGNHPIQV